MHGPREGHVTVPRVLREHGGGHRRAYRRGGEEDAGDEDELASRVGEVKEDTYAECQTGQGGGEDDGAHHRPVLRTGQHQLAHRVLLEDVVRCQQPSHDVRHQVEQQVEDTTVEQVPLVESQPITPRREGLVGPGRFELPTSAM